jgi:hypothetical protein
VAFRRRSNKNRAGDGQPRPTYEAPRRPQLKRERKALLLLREERLRDLGGLALEMYKRDRFNAGLVVDRCAELVAIEARVEEIDALLDGSLHLRAAGAGAVCVCGAPVLISARFCPTCGRQVSGTASETRDDLETGT